MTTKKDGVFRLAINGVNSRFDLNFGMEIVNLLVQIIENKMKKLHCNNWGEQADMGGATI